MRTAPGSFALESSPTKASTMALGDQATRFVESGQGMARTRLPSETRICREGATGHGSDPGRAAMEQR